MTIEQYMNYEKQLVNDINNEDKSTLEMMLEESEKAKKEGLVLSKNQVFSYFMNNYEREI